MMKIKINPVMRKELMVGSRSIKMSLAIMGINGFLAFIVTVMLASMSMGSGAFNYGMLISIFPTLGCIEVGLISLIVPILTSASISGERERQTLDIMLTTPVSPFSIALGKLGHAVMIVMMYAITSLPLFAVAFIFGGLKWRALFGLFAMLVYLGIYVGSVGIFCSSVVKRSIVATILTIVIGVSIIIITGIVLGMGVSFIESAKYANNVASNVPDNLGIIPMVMFVNPYSPIVDFFLRAMTSQSLNSWIQQEGATNGVLNAIYELWIPITVVINLFVSYIFLRLAANSISATKNHKGAKKVKKTVKKEATEA